MINNSSRKPNLDFSIRLFSKVPVDVCTVILTWST